jgi:hypothetical protein
MGEFGFRRRLRLLDQELTLEPEIVAQMRSIEAQLASRQLLPQFLHPNWNLLLPDFRSIVDSPRSDIFGSPTPSQPPSILSFTPGRGPATPRAGELSDVTGAIYQLPAVQLLVTGAHDEAHRQIRLLGREWDNASTGNRIAMISMATIFAGGLIAPIVANQSARDIAFGLIKGRDIPVPGVDGLSFRILDRGGSVTTPLGVPGLSGRARLEFPNSSAPQYEVTVNFDVMEYLRSR